MGKVKRKNRQVLCECYVIVEYSQVEGKVEEGYIRSAMSSGLKYWAFEGTFQIQLQ